MWDYRSRPVQTNHLMNSSENGQRSATSVTNSSSQQRYIALRLVTSNLSVSPPYIPQYSTGYKHGNTDIAQHVAYAGNNAKSLHLSVKASLKKLRTSYIDILYVHWWDYNTSVEEVMNGLHNLVTQGKVLYLVHFLLPSTHIPKFTSANIAGHLRHPNMGRLQSKPIRARPR
jgi:hypothetical protein